MLKNTEGICGIEKRTLDGTKHIISGSEKGIFSTGNLKDAKEIFIFESPIDMQSHKALLKHVSSDYCICTMGSIGDSAEKSLELILDRNKDAKLIIATDNDEGGQKIVDKIATIATSSREIVRDLPKLNDWNDDLKAKIGKAQAQGKTQIKPK